MNAARRHKIPGSEAKDFVTHVAAGSIHFMFISVSLALQILWEIAVRVHMDTMYTIVNLYFLLID